MGNRECNYNICQNGNNSQFGSNARPFDLPHACISITEQSVATGAVPGSSGQG